MTTDEILEQTRENLCGNIFLIVRQKRRCEREKGGCLLSSRKLPEHSIPVKVRTTEVYGRKHYEEKRWQ